MNYSIENVSKDFFVGRRSAPVLDGVSLTVTAGEHLSVLGSSGAGKTTLFRLLNATLRPTRGAVRVDGCDFGVMSSAELRGARRRIGTIYQQHNLVPSLTSLQNTLCGCLGRWSMAQTVRSIFHPAKADVQEALHALELVGLADKRLSRADELSGGQQQRLAIARVLMQKPEVILADEPIASLDRALADEIISLLVRVGSEGQRTLIVALHKVELALEHFPRVIGLGEGKMRFDLPSNTVHEDVLQDLYGKHTAGAVNRLRTESVSNVNSAALDNELFLRGRVVTPRRAAALVAAVLVLVICWEVAGVRLSTVFFGPPRLALCGRCCTDFFPSGSFVWILARCISGAVHHAGYRNCWNISFGADCHSACDIIDTHLMAARNLMVWPT